MSWVKLEAVWQFYYYPTVSVSYYPIGTIKYKTDCKSEKHSPKTPSCKSSYKLLEIRGNSRRDATEEKILFAH